MMLGTEMPTKIQEAEMFLQQKNPGGWYNMNRRGSKPKMHWIYQKLSCWPQGCMTRWLFLTHQSIDDIGLPGLPAAFSFRKRCWQRGNWRSLSVGWERPPLFHINGLPILIQTLTWSNSRRGETQNNKRRNETWIKSNCRLESLDVRCTLYAENDNLISTTFSSRTSVSGSGSIFV